MPNDILVYALHYEGAINKNSLGAISKGAELASQLGGECHALVVGEAGSRARWFNAVDPPAKAGGEIIEDEDTNETVERIVSWLDERKLI